MYVCYLDRGSQVQYVCDGSTIFTDSHPMDMCTSIGFWRPRDSQKSPLKLLGDMYQVLDTKNIWQENCAILRQTKNIIHLVREYTVLELMNRDVKIPLANEDTDSM